MPPCSIRGAPGWAQASPSAPATTVEASDISMKALRVTLPARGGAGSGSFSLRSRMRLLLPRVERPPGGESKSRATRRLAHGGHPGPAPDELDGSGSVTDPLPAGPAGPQAAGARAPMLE